MFYCRHWGFPMLFLYQTKQKQNTLRNYRIKAVIDKEKGDYIGPRALVAIIGLKTATCVSRRVENWPAEFPCCNKIFLNHWVAVWTVVTNVRWQRWPADCRSPLIYLLKHFRPILLATPKMRSPHFSLLKSLTQIFFWNCTHVHCRNMHRARIKENITGVIFGTDFLCAN